MDSNASRIRLFEENSFFDMPESGEPAIAPEYLSDDYYFEYIWKEDGSFHTKLHVVED